MIALAALAMGAAVGFLFGLPRSLTSSDFRAAVQAKAAARQTGQAESETVADDDSAAGRPAVAAAQASEVNTNLEKISDWLTTIIVGVGLTKLQEIPGGIEAFGERVAPYFAYGGKVFGIAGGLFFLIGGFFLAYVGTRVKLSFIFLVSQLANRAAQVFEYNVVRTSIGAEIGPDAISDEVKKADAIILSRSLSDLKTPAEVLAWANAKARTGDFTSALAAYRDVVNRVPATEKLQTDYAQVLAGAGDVVGANNVVASLATTGITPEAEQEARQKVAAAAQAGRASALRTRLQQGLYNGGYEDAISAGEELVKLPEGARDAWVHLWLAAAYGQKHASKRVGEAKGDTPEQRPLRERAVEEVKKALEIDPGVKLVIRGMYDPAYRVGSDDDLDSLRPDEALDAMFADTASGQT